MTIFLKRKGPTLFWRFGRIGGSFYLAKNASGKAPKRRDGGSGPATAGNRPPHAQRSPLRPGGAV